MNIHRLIAVLVGVTLSGGLIASSATAQSMDSSKQNSQVQHLTCVKDTQGLMCTVDKTLDAASGVQQTNSKSDLAASEQATNEQLGQISDALLVIMYVGLPIALVFAILRYDKRHAELARSIEGLERIWNQDPQS